MDEPGDGLDISGPITMTGGLLIVDGPTSNGNGRVDFLGSFAITAGTFLAVGSAGMALGPTTDSTQRSLMLTTSRVLSAGTMIHIETEDGQDVLTFTTIREYQSVVSRSSKLEAGATYMTYTGGNSDGTPLDGLYSAGSYVPGTRLETAKLSDIVTCAGT